MLRHALAVATSLAACAALPAAAQQVHVFAAAQPALGTTTTLSVNDDDAGQKVLVIPVVTQDTAFDPANNDLAGIDPALQGNLQNKFQTVSDFWSENSYTRVSFQTDVLGRFYQMPRGLDHYFNPAFQAARVTGSATLSEPVAVPTGTLQLRVHVSTSDETTVTVPFDAADSPYTFAQLETKLSDAIAPLGDKLAVSIFGGATRRLRFTVGQRHVREGTFVRIQAAGSDPAVLDALGLDTPLEDLAAPRITSRGSAFPLNPAAASTLTLTVENEAGATEPFAWAIPAGALADAAAFVAAHGATHANATISEDAGELRFDVTPGIALPIESLTFTIVGDLDLDALGLDEIAETTGVVSFAARNTVRGNRRLITGQAIAAYVLNELGRPAAPPGNIPNLAITAANEAQIDAALANAVDTYAAFAVLFLDGGGKRAGASGGYIDVGIENAGFLYQYQTFGDIQLAFQTTSAATFAHEIGHNIGFYDLYDNSGGNYGPDLEYPLDWDSMHRQSELPHTGGLHKEQRATWVSRDGTTVASFPLPATPGVETRQFALTPLEFGNAQYDSQVAPPGGRTEAKLIRLPLGLGPTQNDHYLLLQNRQPGASFSQDLPQAAGAPEAGGLYVTDVITRKFFNYFGITSRNFVHPLTDVPLVAVPNPGNTSPVVDRAPQPDVTLTGTYPAYAGFTIDVVGSQAGPAGLPETLLVNVSREQSDFLDLRITPWGAPPWESPDIWLEHGDEPLGTVPLPGNGEPVRWSPDYDPAANGGVPLNFVRVLVTNDGTVDATDVQVKLRINTPGGMGGSGTWAELPLSAPQDVPAGGSAIFDFPWNPRVDRHTCVKAEIFRWDSVLGDIEPFNNGTQENVNDFNPGASSPWQPEPFEFEVANPLDHDVEVEVQPIGLTPGLVVEIERTMFQVPARSRVQVAAVLRLDETHIPVPPFESFDAYLKRRPRERRFHLEGFALAGDFRVPIGGITYDVQPARNVVIHVDVGVDRDGDIVVEGTTKPPAPGQDIEIEVRYPSGRHVWLDVQTDTDGSIDETIEPEEDGSVRLAVNYPPGGAFAPTRTGDVTVDTREPTPRPTIPPALCCWIALVLLVVVVILLLVLWRR